MAKRFNEDSMAQKKRAVNPLVPIKQVAELGAVFCQKMIVDYRSSKPNYRSKIPQPEQNNQDHHLDSLENSQWQIDMLALRYQIQQK
jgi:hypothetical protein